MDWQSSPRSPGPRKSPESSHQSPPSQTLQGGPGSTQNRVQIWLKENHRKDDGEQFFRRTIIAIILFGGSTGFSALKTNSSELPLESRLTQPEITVLLNAFPVAITVFPHVGNPMPEATTKFRDGIYHP